MRALIAIAVVVALATTAGAGENLGARLAKSGLVDVKVHAPTAQVALAYSTTDNFLGADVYGDLDTCYLNPDAARMVGEAAKLLAKRAPELRLHIYDCVRPLSVQRAMWKIVKGTKQRAYVANPNKKVKSLHNYGCAVDLTLATADGKPIDMGTPFDHFGVEAEPRREAELLEAGTLSSTQVSNRLILRRAMVDAGFLPLANEWWHFACATGKKARSTYSVVR